MKAVVVLPFMFCNKVSRFQISKGLDFLWGLIQAKTACANNWSYSLPRNAVLLGRFTFQGDFRNLQTHVVNLSSPRTPAWGGRLVRSIKLLSFFLLRLQFQLSKLRCIRWPVDSRMFLWLVVVCSLTGANAYVESSDKETSYKGKVKLMKKNIPSILKLP